MHLLPPQQQPSSLPRARWWRPECIGSQRRTSCQGRRNRHILRKRVKLGGVWRSISCAFRHCDSSESHLDSVLNSLSFIRCLPIFAGTDLSLVKQAAGSSASSVFAQLQTLNLRLQTSVLCVCARTAKPSHSRLQTKMHELSRRRPSALTAISATTTARYVVVLHSFVSCIICRRHITNVWVCTPFFKAPSYGLVKHDTVVALQRSSNKNIS